MSSIPAGWSKKNGKLTANFKCKDFVHALTLLNSIGNIAEKFQHHPDLGIRNYNEVFVSTVTHETNSITEKDYNLASEINTLLDSQKRKNL
jgi:4a-hydroxytetrahydrobiopterin dehydratase